MYLGNDRIIDLLVKHGADVNHSDQSGQTPLHFAVLSNFLFFTIFIIKRHLRSQRYICDIFNITDFFTRW